MFLNSLKSYAGVLPRKVLHLGANIGQEAASYANAGIEAYHVEALPDLFRKVEAACARYSGQTPIHACLDSDAGRTVRFNVASNNGQASSMLQLGRHAAAYPHISYTDTVELTTQTIDGLLEAGTIPDDIEFALLDLQGAEERALRGASRFLSSERLWGLQVEVAIEPLYEGGTDFLTLCSEVLLPRGFFLRNVQFNGQGWSDALFLRRWWPRISGELPPLALATTARQPDLSRGRNIGPEGVCTQSSVSRWSEAEDAARAVSVPLTGRFAFHTAVEDGPWWQVDFGAPRRFDEILCYNRLDHGAERARGLVVELSDDGKTWTELHRAYEAFGGLLDSRGPLQLKCPGARARLIRLRLEGRTPLHLDGVRILDYFAASSDG
jgi:FkbM family methyltransferase